MTTVKWSTPKRLAGSTQLSPIPNEIYLEIFDHLSPSYANGFTESECKHALTNLALVCRFFCAMALPRIFKSLEFSGSLSNEPSAKPSYSSFCRAVIKGQEPAASLSLYVKECTFTSWRREDTISDWVSHGFLGMYGQALGRMSNLQSVSLHMVDVDKRFLKAICGLKSLQSLSIQFCSLDRTGNITDRVIQKLTPLKLKSFSYRAFVDDPLQAKVFARIVNTSSLESLQVNSWIVARNIFMEFGMESSLIDLDLSEARDDPIWWKVLDLSKAMKSMRIGRLTRPAGDPSSITPLSPSSMPQLCTLDAPLLLALAIVPGRPLHTIIIPDRPCCSPIRVVEINQLKCSTIPVRVLDISDAISRQISFDFFPQLEVLRLSYNCDHDKQDLCSKPSLFEDGLHKIAQKWRSTPPLRELYFQFSMSDIRKNKTFLDLEFHHKIIVKHLANAFPNLNVFSLIHFVHWRKDYRSGFWVPYVPVEYRIELRALFRKGSLPKFQDFDGCLGTILSS